MSLDFEGLKSNSELRARLFKNVIDNLVENDALPADRLAIIQTENGEELVSLARLLHESEGADLPSYSDITVRFFMQNLVNSIPDGELTEEIVQIAFSKLKALYNAFGIKVSDEFAETIDGLFIQ
jgi:hypothetical protein